MRLALMLGRRGQGRVWPNPAVGCVLVKDGRVISRGWTQPGGRPHAEAHALGQTDQTQGATAYVTLEPCAHQGKTGPCANALVAAGITTCIIATTDPDPRVSGKGIKILQDAGVEVRLGICQRQADEDHAGFFKRVAKGQPRVTLKLAQSLDGRIATATGDSQWITGPMARRHVHAERARHDAILVGAGTAKGDDPSLTVRNLGMDQSPIRIVAARELGFDGKNLKHDLPQVPLWLLHGDGVKTSKRASWEAAGATCIEIPIKKGNLDVAAMLQALGQRGLTSVYCEGGGTLAASLLLEDAVDDMIIYNAGVAIGAEGRPSLGGLGLDVLAQAERFDLKSHSQIGSDIRTHWVRRP